MKRRYTILLEQHPGTDISTVTVPLLAGRMTPANGVRQAVERAREVIQQGIAVLQEDGEEIAGEEGTFALATVRCRDR
jgi:predicted RNase H-like HicB family nuclease